MATLARARPEADTAWENAVTARETVRNMEMEAVGETAGNMEMEAAEETAGNMAVEAAREAAGIQEDMEAEDAAATGAETAGMST